MKKYIATFICICTVILAAPMISCAATAGNGVTLTVGLDAAGDGLYSVNRGEYSGLIPQYFEYINMFMGENVKLRYVSAPSSQLSELLKDGGIDIVCAPDYHADSHAPSDALFLAEPITRFRLALFAARENKNAYFDDFKAFNNMKIGFCGETFHLEALNDYASRNGFSFDAHEYETSKRMWGNVERGNVDAAVARINDPEVDGKLIGMIADVPVTIGVNAASHELFKSLQKAQQNVMLYYANAVERYLSEYENKPAACVYALNREEAEFIAHQPPIRVACAFENTPLEYYDKQERAYRGTYIDVLNYISHNSGLKFEVIRTDSAEASLKAVRDGQAEILLSAYANDNFKSQLGLTLTEPIARSSLVLVGKKGREIAADGSNTVAVSLQYSGMAYYLNENYSKWRLEFYRNMDECIDAVNRGDVDFTVQDSTIFQNALLQNTYPGITTIHPGGYDADIVMAVGGQASPLILNVLDKTIFTMGKERPTSFMDDKTDIFSGISYFLRAYQFQITVGILAFCILVTAMFGLYQYRLFRAAYTDRLTKLFNANYLQAKGEKLFSPPDKTAIISIDIAKMRQINESFGSETGDKILQYVSAELKKEYHERCVVVRNNSDNFVVLTPCSPGGEGALVNRAKRLIEYMRDYDDGQISTKLRFCVGVCVGRRGVTFGNTMNMAHAARRDAKQRGETLILFSDGMLERMKSEKQIEDRMEAALEEGEFKVFYQPKYSLITGTPISAEALVRWKPDGDAMIFPSDFIPLFEKNGFIVQLDNYILDHVCATMRRLIDMGENVVPVSVNQSRRHLDDPDYVQKVSSIRKKYNIPDGLIELELTEYSFENRDVIVDALRGLKSEGFLLSIDDFGSGYSSLNLLWECPIDYVKIDRKFLKDSLVSDEMRSVIGSIIRMADTLGIKTVCEGVEHESQAEMLRSLGCEIAQGWLYSKAMPEDMYIDKLYGDRKKPLAEEPGATI